MTRYFLSFLIFLNLTGYAQDGSLDTSFNVGSGTDSNVYLLKQLSTGKILLGGQFVTYNGVAAEEILRLNDDGSIDTSFSSGSGVNFMVNDAVEDNGKVIIVGEFSLYNGIMRNCIARLNNDGSVDTTFDPQNGVSNRILNISKQGDKFIITGAFGLYNGHQAGNIARINADGSFDDTFQSQGTDTGLQQVIAQHVMQPDGKIMIAGNFSSYNGTPVSRMARLNADGTIDTTFNPMDSANTTILSVAMQPDGKYLISGLFGEYDSNYSPLIARINADGSFDSTFTAGSGYGIAATSLIVQPDYKILSGGFLTTFGGNGRYLLRLLPDGTIDPDFDDSQGADNIINEIFLQQDSKILIGGWFNHFNDTEINRVARLNNEPVLATVAFKSAYRLYPNPVIDQLHLESNQSDALQDVKLLDMSGKELPVKMTHFAHHATIDMSSLQNGIYFLKSQTANGLFRQKIIKE